MSDQHVLPLGDLVDHDETRTCWCGPKVEVPCDACEGVVLETVVCWKCGDQRWVPALSGDARPAVVVHNAADGRK